MVKKSGVETTKNGGKYMYIFKVNDFNINI